MGDRARPAGTWAGPSGWVSVRLLGLGGPGPGGNGDGQQRAERFFDDHGPAATPASPRGGGRGLFGAGGAGCVDPGHGHGGRSGGSFPGRRRGADRSHQQAQPAPADLAAASGHGDVRCRPVPSGGPPRLRRRQPHATPRWPRRRADPLHRHLQRHPRRRPGRGRERPLAVGPRRRGQRRGLTRRPPRSGRGGRCGLDLRGDHPHGGFGPGRPGLDHPGRHQRRAPVPHGHRQRG